MGTAKTTKPFTMVRRSIWSSERFKALPNDAARYLYLYFLTCHHQTASGCFVLKEAYALADLEMQGADWTNLKYRQTLDAIVKSGLILHDAKTGEILITRWWKDNRPSNSSWIEGARRQCEGIQSPELRQSALDALNECIGLPTSNQTSPSGAGAEKLRVLRNRIDAH